MKWQKQERAKVAELEKIMDGIDGERRAALDLCIHRNKELAFRDQRIRDLEAALRGCFCPRPCNGRPDYFTVGECVDAGECGCCDGAPLKGKEPA